MKNHPNRKKEGLYYTNLKLSEFIFKKTLITYLNSLLNLKIIKLENIFNQESEKRLKIQDILRNLTICDPTCGSGNFLLNIAKILFFLISNIFNQKIDSKQIKAQILKNIYGFDINKSSLTLSKLKLINWYFNGEFKNYDYISSILDSNLDNRNSLLISYPSELNLEIKKFDIIVGNPPYGNILNDREKRILKKQQIYFNDIYCAYLLQALKLSRGLIGFLVPKSFLIRQSYNEFRNKLLSQTNFLQIYDLGSNIFKKATNEVQILIYGGKRRIKRDLEVYDFPDKKLITYPNQSFDSLRICKNEICPLINRIKKFYIYTKKQKCPYCSQPTTPLNRIRIKGDSNIFNLIEQIEEDSNLNYLNVKDFPLFIRGEEAHGLSLVRTAIEKNSNGSCFFLDAKKDFNYFYFNESKSFNLTNINSEELKGENNEFYISPKLLIKHNNIYPEALYTEKNVCFTSSIYSLLHKNSIELKYICALLNSIVIHFYSIFGINNQKNTTINLNQYMIRHLPIINVKQEVKSDIAEKVDLISSNLEKRKRLNREIKRDIRNLNSLIFDIYAMNSKEQKIMINKVKLYNSHLKLVYEDYQ